MVPRTAACHLGMRACQLAERTALVLAFHHAEGSSEDLPLPDGNPNPATPWSQRRERLARYAQPACVLTPAQQPVSAAIVLEIEFRVTNHDPVPHLLWSIRGLHQVSFPPPEDPTLIAAHREEQAIKDRRRRNGEELPPRVQPGETVRGVYVTTFPCDPTGALSDYTLVINNERHAYTARPHGAGEDPLAAWPIT